MNSTSKSIKTLNNQISCIDGEALYAMDINYPSNAANLKPLYPNMSCLDWLATVKSATRRCSHVRLAERLMLQLNNLYLHRDTRGGLRFNPQSVDMQQQGLKERTHTEMDFKRCSTESWELARLLQSALIVRQDDPSGVALRK